MLDPEEGEFIFQSSILDELGPSSVDDNEDDRPVPLSGTLPINIPEEPDQGLHEDDEVQEDLALLD